MTDRFDGIEAFLQAVEAGNFALASERLGQTRSAIGKRIARLEARLGVRLFHRSTRRQTLTEDGQAYYERCKRALTELDAADAELSSQRREPAGRLRVTAPTLFGRHAVAPILGALVQQHPKLELELSLSDRVVDLLEDGFDLAVRIGALRDSSTLAARRLGRQRFVLCAAPSCLAQLGWNGRPESLEGASGIAYGNAGRSVPWQMRDAQGQLHALPITTRMRFDDVAAIGDAAVAGFGIARLPEWLIVRELASGALQRLDEHGVEDTDIHVVWPHARHLPAKTRAAIDALALEVPALLSPDSNRAVTVKQLSP